jgi:kelch-like protein 2/3
LRVGGPLNEVCPNLEQVAQCDISHVPPWKMKRPEVDLTLSKYPKDSTQPEFFQGLFHSLKDTLDNHKAIYTDGSKDGERVAAAAISDDLNVQIRLQDGASIYTAELRAIRRALDIISSSGEDKFLIVSDSLSSLTALKGNNYDNPDVLYILERCHFLIQDGKAITFVWCPSHIGIKGNETADRMAKEALNHRISELWIPYTDLKPKINRYVYDKWQRTWDVEVDNKLHSIRPDLTQSWSKGFRSDRREEVVLARSRIGHTHFTHSYLLKREDRPECIPCATPLTVKHILVDCIDFAHVRPRYFQANSMKDLFDSVDPSKILNFLRHIRLFYKF